MWYEQPDILQNPHMRHWCDQGEIFISTMNELSWEEHEMVSEVTDGILLTVGPSAVKTSLKIMEH
ncbi:hypothetical protein ANCDUO_25299 [Ancylostoma duodenale]|uniref:Uncharacterized protein n=1 Tax=Ancylostoma duodenale TaxID=51022 RepID=A0A0C2F843_9BILA|nr:hypothetical protein ANCDUO_25299 [Ancylostoma duodenale]